MEPASQAFRLPGSGTRVIPAVACCRVATDDDGRARRGRVGKHYGGARTSVLVNRVRDRVAVHGHVTRRGDRQCPDTALVDFDLHGLVIPRGCRRARKCADDEQREECEAGREEGESLQRKRASLDVRWKERQSRPPEWKHRSAG